MLEIHGAISTREVQMSIQLDEWNGCVCDEIIWWMAVYAKKKQKNYDAVIGRTPIGFCKFGLLVLSILD